VFVASVIKHAKPMRRVMPSSVACPDLHDLHDLHDFWKKRKGFWTKNVSWFSIRILSETIL